MCNIRHGVKPDLLSLTIKGVKTTAGYLHLYWNVDGVDLLDCFVSNLISFIQ
jgi:hypothetical protein